MLALKVGFLVLYFLVFVLLVIYGLHRYFLVYLYYRHKHRVPQPSGRFPTLPRVTVQLPIYNERYVVERLIDSVCAIDYPRDRLEIQVLDDSTDDTQDIAVARVEEYRRKGFDIGYRHRPHRQGFKAGALGEGLREATGEFILIFDADFISAPEILHQTIQYFSDPRIGMVQVRWGHINRNYSLLTRVQSIFLDGHFVIEHTARSRSGRFFNFNGTAGIWRRECIISSGGWQHDTLTEDLDLSYRAQLAGWRFVFLPHILSPAEVPVEINSFKTQQHRWAKGSIQTARKLLPRILRSPLPLPVKLEATFHLTNNMAYPLMILLTVLLLPTMIMRLALGWKEMLLIDAPLFVAATSSVSLFYICSQREIREDWRRQLKYLPALMSFGIGLSVNNAKAVLEALWGSRSEFQRTPKFRIESQRDEWRTKSYKAKRNFVPLVELFLGGYMLYNIVFAISNGLYFSVPFLLIFQVGFLYTAFMSFFQSGRRLPLRG